MFKYLRITTAIVLIAICVMEFASAVYHQSSSMLDGPLAWLIQYTWALNKIVLSSLLAIVLIWDFKIILPAWGPMVLKFVGGISLALSVIGLLYLVKHHWETRIDSERLLYDILYFYIRQLAFILVSIIAISKGLEENNHA